jgi:hypothetical protein
VYGKPFNLGSVQGILLDIRPVDLCCESGVFKVGRTYVVGYIRDMLNWLFIVVFSSVGPIANAQDLVDVTVDVATEKKGLSQKEVFDQAIEKVSHQRIEQLIGDAKAAKNSSLIKNRIIKNSGKYVMFIKAQNPVQAGNGLRYPVNLKISTKSLETLLLREGLLYKTDGPPKLLPMVSFVDRVNSQMFTWWNQPPQVQRGFLADLASHFHRGFRKELRAKGFFGLDPITGNYRQLLPAALQVENPSTEDLLLLTEFYRAQVVARGQVVVAPQRTRSDVYRIEVRLAALHATNGRVIGEVIRGYDSEPGPFNQVVKAKLDEVLEKLAGDLSTQILDAWKSGTFGASLLNLAVNGDLNYQQRAQFKKLLQEQIRDIKTLKERLFEPGRVVYEMDSAATSDQLADLLKQRNFPRFQVSVGDVRPEGVELRVTAK